MTRRTFGEVVSGPGQTARGNACSAHNLDLAPASPGRSAPCAASGRPEGRRPACLLAARGAEDMSVLREQIVQRLAEVCRLGNSCLVGQFPKLGNGIRGVVTRHLCLITFRFRDQSHTLLYAMTYV